MNNIILTSSFNSVAHELQEKGFIPHGASRVAFIPTAADIYDEKPWVEADRNALIGLGYEVFDLFLKEQSVEQLKEELRTANIVFVAGGNTTYLVERVHMCGFEQAVRDLLSEDRIYIGSSAGSILAGSTVEPFLEEDTSELPKDFTLHDSTCLGLVDYIVLPHYPSFREQNDKIQEKFSNRFTFMKMTDHDYRLSSYPLARTELFLRT